MWRKIMKRKLPKMSSLGKLKAECDKLFFKVLLAERGPKCEFCGETTQLSPFHILPKSTHQRIRYLKTNLLISCVQCHIFKWHSGDHYKSAPIEKEIKRLRGKEYKDTLKVFNKTMPVLGRHELNKYIMAFKKQLKWKS